jgi:hypothetical protein
LKKKKKKKKKTPVILSCIGKRWGSRLSWLSASLKAANDFIAGKYLAIEWIELRESK